jgi:alkylation response protein AidB-like acyl-CoA dehydrogenase
MSMNIQSKGISTLLRPPVQPPVNQGTSAPVHFGNIHKDEIKDSEDLVHEKNKGTGVFAHLLSRGHFPLNLVSGVELELSPEKKKSMAAYTQLVDTGLRPSAAPYLRELQELETRLNGMTERQVNTQAFSEWLAAGKTQAQAVNNADTQASVRQWLEAGKKLAASVATDSKPLQVWAKDLDRVANRLMTWMDKDQKALQTLENPTPELKQWMETLKITPQHLRTAVLDADAIDQEAYIPSEVLLRSRDLGLFKLKVPKEYGGLDLHQKEYHRVVRELPKLSGTLGAAFSAHNTIGSAPLVLNGTKAQQEEYLPQIAEGNFMAAFGLTEPGAGTDTKKLKTTATLSPDGKEWIINGESGAFGEKIYITNTHRSGVMFLMAKTDLGEHFGTPGENAMITKWLYLNKQSRRNPNGKVNEFGDPVGTQYPNGTPWEADPKDRTGKSLNFDYIRAQNPDKPWQSQSNKLLKESVVILDLPFRITDTKQERAEKMKDLAEKGMVIADPLELMMIRGSNQAFIRFNNFRVPVNKVLGGVGEDVAPLLKTLEEHKNDAAVPGLNWQKMTLNGERLKLDGAGQGMTDVFNALNRGRAGFGPSYAGAVRAMLEETRKYALNRDMFDVYGGKQSDMPIVKKYLGDMAMKSAALDAVSELTSALIEEKGDDINIIDICAAIKVISTDWNWETAEKAMRIHGGTGTRRGHESGMERAFRDAWIGLIVEGVNEAMQQVVVGSGATPAMKDLEALTENLFSSFTPKKLWDKTKLLARLASGPIPPRITASLGLPIPGLKDINLLTLRRQKGVLDPADAAWLQSRTAQLYRRSSAWGARYQEKMLGRQNELIRLSDIALDLYSLAAVQIKLKKATDLPEEEKVSLQEFVKVTRRQIDHNLKEFSYISENPDDRSAVKAANAHFSVEKKLSNEDKAVTPKG